MKIAKFSTRLVSVPREQGPLGEGPGSVAANFVTLKVTTDDGVEGIGYAGLTSAVMRKALRETVKDGVNHSNRCRRPRWRRSCHRGSQNKQLRLSLRERSIRGRQRQSSRRADR